MSQLTPEICKTTCINTIEQYLQINKIKYDKIDEVIDILKSIS